MSITLSGMTTDFIFISSKAKLPITLTVAGISVALQPAISTSPFFEIIALGCSI
jgi:hypothetical protein